MDEGAGDQLDNSNLQEQEKNEQSQQKPPSPNQAPSPSSSSSLSILNSSHHHQQQQQIQQEHHSEEPHDKAKLLSSSSTTTNLNNSQQTAAINSTQQTIAAAAAASSSTSSTPTSSSSSTTITTPSTQNNNNTNASSNSNNNNIKNNTNSSSLSNNEHSPKRNPTEDLFSTKRWGVTPIRQDTPWELPPSPTQTNSTANLISSGPTGGVQGNSGPTLPPGISQSGDSFRSGTSVKDFTSGHGGPTLVNNFTSSVDSMSAANGLANSLGHMNLGGPGVLHSSRFDQPWRAPAAKQHQSSMATASPFANHNLMNPAPSGMQKSMLNSGSGNGGGSAFVAMQQPGNEFARAPGPATPMMDNNMAPKPFGMASRSSTWSAFGTPAPNEPEPEWPKSTTSGISLGNSTQSSNAFDLVPEFEPGKPWHGSMLMKGLDDDSSINSGSAGMSAFANAYASSSKSPTGSQYEHSGIGTWSPIVKGGRPGSKWDCDGPDNGRGDNGRFDDGTAIWGSPAQSKVVGVDWVEKTGDANSNNDKSRSIAGNNQSYRPQQSSSSTSLLMSSNTSPSSQHSRNQTSLKQPSLSHNFDQVQQQSNALSSQPNQPNRGLGLSSNVPSTQQLKHMVAQIQLAVQAGHLNPQILNQPLAPVTLQLLYQLLQQIKALHQLQMQASQQFKQGNQPAAVNVHITKTKQNILNLQNQIAAQQAKYLQQQQAQQQNISRQPTMPSLAAGGVGDGIGPTLPPGISQSGDSFRTGASVNDFSGHGGPTLVNNFTSSVDSMSAANGLANSLGHMNLGGPGVLHSSRFDQPWRAPATKQHQSSMATASPFANHNLMNPAPSGMQKSMLNSGSGNGGGSAFVAMQQPGNEFARAPGPATPMMDNNMAPKPFGMASRSSTWSAFGTPAPNEPEPEWPKSTTSGISLGNSTQSSNAFDLVPEFEPGKPWRGSMLMKSVEDDPTMTPGSMARSLAPQRKTIWSDEIL